MRKEALCLAMGASLFACRTTQGVSPKLSDSDGIENPGELNAPGEGEASAQSSASSASSTPRSTSSGSVPRPTSANELQLKQTCDRPIQLLEHSYALRFAARSGCSFGITPHHPASPGILSAYATSTQDVSLPSNEQVCGFRLQLAADRFRYTDVLQLNVQDYTLFTSQATGPRNPSSATPGLFDPSSLYGVAIDTEATASCASASTCRWPKATQEGPLAFDQKQEGGPLITAMIQQKSARVQLAIWGDQDPGDCTHSELTGTLTLYTIKP